MWLFACCGRRERAATPEAGVGFGYGCDERTPLIQDSPEEAAACVLRLSAHNDYVDGIWVRFLGWPGGWMNRR